MELRDNGREGRKRQVMGWWKWEEGEKEDDDE